ncbi:hypothetical protein MKX03_022820 [Papaver bracteatum]|nr:hypothetical protein MKX03_022820 [Papaver bracteatum]
MGLIISLLLGKKKSKRRSKKKTPPPFPIPPLLAPLQPGSKLNCTKYGAARPVKIISIVVLEDGSFEYFVIYINPNAHRRNDEWVQLAQLEMESLMPNVEDVTPEELSRVRTVDFIQLRRNEIKTWYPSPVMSEFKDCIKLHVCECCLAFTNSKTLLNRHKKECQGRDPPGHKIYIDGKLSVFQIDGAKHKDYCDNICYLGSMFLDIMPNSERSESSMFYVLVVRDDSGYDLIAYFSEVKQMMEPYDLHVSSKGVKMWVPFHIIASSGIGSFSGQSYEDLSRLTGLPVEDVRTTLLGLRGLERKQRKFNYHFSLYSGIQDEFQTGIELHNTKNLDTQVDRCPEFDVDSMMSPHHQGRMKALLLLFLSFSFCLVTFIPRFL